MFETIDLNDAQTKLAEILRRVEAGESFTITITITNQGKPIADIVPSRIQGHLKAKTAINNILSAKNTLFLMNISLN